MENKIQYLLDNIKEGLFNPFYKEDVKLSLNYTYEDILRIEKYINRRLPLNDETPSHIIVALGVYLGQIIIKQLDGEWKFNEGDNIAHMSVVVKAKESFELKPFIRIETYIKNRNDSIEGWYYLAKRYHNGEIELDKLQSGKWYDNNGKGRFRTISAN